MSRCWALTWGLEGTLNTMRYFAALGSGALVLGGATVLAAAVPESAEAAGYGYNVPQASGCDTATGTQWVTVSNQIQDGTADTATISDIRGDALSVVGGIVGPYSLQSVSAPFPGGCVMVTPVDPVDPVDPVGPVDPVDPVDPETPEEPLQTKPPTEESVDPEAQATPQAAAQAAAQPKTLATTGGFDAGTIGLIGGLAVIGGLVAVGASRVRSARI